MTATGTVMTTIAMLQTIGSYGLANEVKAKVLPHAELADAAGNRRDRAKFDLHVKRTRELLTSMIEDRGGE